MIEEKTFKWLLKKAADKYVFPTCCIVGGGWIFYCWFIKNERTFTGYFDRELFLNSSVLLFIIFLFILACMVLMKEAGSKHEIIKYYHSKSQEQDPREEMMKKISEECSK